MATVLEQIIAKKREEISRLKEMSFPKSTVVRKKRSLLTKLEGAGEMVVVAEFKRSSPSKGSINLSAHPAVQAKTYAQAGADAVSVLTDTPYFQGTWEDLRLVRETIDLPILCKDFILHPVQIDAAEHFGADLILLIVAALDDEQLKSLYEYAREKQMEVLLEVHDEEELERALQTDNPLIGVNNRNLKTFAVDLTVTETLAPLVKKENRFLISESGMKTQEDVIRVRDAGADGILVGETLMRHSDPAKAIREMKIPLSR